MAYQSNFKGSQIESILGNTQKKYSSRYCS